MLEIFSRYRYIRPYPDDISGYDPNREFMIFMKLAVGYAPAKSRWIL